MEDYEREKHCAPKNFNMQSYKPSPENITVANQSTHLVNSIDTKQQQANEISVLFLGLFICSLVGIVTYKKYRIDAKKKRLQMLERVWRLNIHEQSY